MYYQNYEDYMRSILGYPVSNDIYTYENANYYYGEDNNRNCNINEQDIYNMYPNIYKKINPIVLRECDCYNDKITKDVVENIVEKIYSIVEQDNEVNILNINIENNRSINKSNNENIIQNRNIDSSRSIQNNVRERLQNINRNGINESNLKEIKEENRGRRQNNPLLRDLIHILVLNRLLNRPGNIEPRPPHPRPPFIPQGPRPIYPMQPARPGIDYPINPRPPMPRQEEFDNYSK